MARVRARWEEESPVDEGQNSWVQTLFPNAQIFEANQMQSCELHCSIGHMLLHPRVQSIDASYDGSF